MKSKESEENTFRNPMSTKSTEFFFRSASFLGRDLRGEREEPSAARNEEEERMGSGKGARLGFVILIV
jgi:hypothetical protein